MHTPGKFVWFEHYSKQREVARRFYEKLFHWQFEDESMPGSAENYTMIKNKDPIAGLCDVPAEDPSEGYWLGYLSVRDVDKTSDAAISQGGKKIKSLNYPQCGHGSIIKDTEGAVFAVWKNDKEDPPDTPECNVPLGSWCWTELVTTNDKAALTFYGAVAGFTSEAKHIGPAGTYYLLKHEGMPRAGLIQPKAPPPVAKWAPYVNVADCDAIATQAQQLGATIAVPPTDIPDVGRFAFFVDPTGAWFGVMAGL